MLYRVLKRMIERGQTEGLAEKLDVFYAAGKLTDDEYQELTAQLEAKQQELAEKEAQSNG